ncbi:MAG TPA: 3-oxoadipate enol-lactonase [Bryobacteraceae bacterium]|nr:3-oxoadipate enol-lactonase [Bryobacteraceae bacterium]
MPFIHIDGVRIYYRLDGAEDRPALVLSHSLGVDHGQWDSQMPDLIPSFRVLRYDIRGHGASDAPSGDYSIERLGRDVLALADALNILNFAFCGVSLGGMIGQWLAARAADRLTHAVLANTSARLPDPSAMETRRKTVLDSGMSAIVDMAMGRFFSQGNTSPQTVSIRRTFLATNPEGYAGCCAAIRDMDNRPLLHGINIPALVIGGDRDISTPWTGNGDVLAESIPDVKTLQLPAAHLSNVERPRSFSAALLDFALPRSSGGPLEAGFATRRAVLGEDYVDRAIARTTSFTREFQEMITRQAWGTIWTRPGLDWLTRRLLTLATTAALGRWEEFRLHVRTGLAHDLEPCDIKEVLLQTAIYAGIPAANTAFTIAGEEISSQEPQ